MQLSDLNLKIEPREKKSFWSSDFERPVLDLYFAFKGEPHTNPPNWYDTLKWGAGNGVEDSFIKILKDSGIIDESYDQKVDGRIEITRENVPITGYIDAITKDGYPVEIKSINNANYFDVKRYEAGEPRSNYVGQLSIYMDALGVDRGYLLVSSIDGLNRFLFECTRDNNLFKCGETVVDLDKQYKRWSKLYHNNVLKSIQPKPTEYLYKYPVDEIDWSEVSKSNISKARNDKKILGDYQVTYSNWKNKIIELQGTELGYTTEELKTIKEATDGYTTDDWGKK